MSQDLSSFIVAGFINLQTDVNSREHHDQNFPLHPSESKTKILIRHGKRQNNITTKTKRTKIKMKTQLCYRPLRMTLHFGGTSNVPTFPCRLMGRPCDKEIPRRCFKVFANVLSICFVFSQCLPNRLFRKILFLGA